MQDHLTEDPAQLLLRHRQSNKFDLKEAVAQIAARQKGRRKLPEWAANKAVIFPPAVSMEQCSSEQTATFKKRLAKGGFLLDLTGGFGVDSYYLGKQFEKVAYVERQDKLAAIADYNFSVLSGGDGKYQVYCGDALAFLRTVEGIADWIYVDPARRGGANQKLYKLADCEPDIIGHWESLTQKAQHIMIKASPMLDIKEAIRELPGLSEVHVVAVKNEVKELLLVWKREQEGAAQVMTWDLPHDEPFHFDFNKEEHAASTFSLPKNYLVIPSAAILKAGAFKVFGNRYRLHKVHMHTHLYTTDELSKTSGVLGRVFRIQEEVKMEKKAIGKAFPAGQVNVITRNYPMKPEIIKKKFRLKDGGEDFLIACTVQDGTPKAYRCRRVG